MATKSPTSRALAELKQLKYVAQVVERWNPWAKKRIDLFGFADLIYLTDASIVALQVTTDDNLSKRRAKIVAEPRAKAWLQAGGLIEVWGYGKKGARGEVKKWVCRKEEIVMEDFA